MVKRSHRRLFVVLLLFLVLLTVGAPIVYFVMLARARDAARSTAEELNYTLVSHTWIAYRYRNHGRFPSDIVGKDGKPLLSWRVRILPMLDEQELYEQFRLDERWDSDHNKALLEKMPTLYQDHWDRENRTQTRLQSVTGKGRVLPGPTAEDDVRDGQSETVALVCAAKPVPWTQPADVATEKNVADALYFRGEASPVSYLDGHVSSLPRLTDEVYHKLFGINDGKRVYETELHGDQ